ncbi:YgaP family membrane protein [Roseovarius sp. E0-M6]|uniref:YgaP family membrane protein n=1 Tax=Roseovarius sp. E0-M6 TaxID=3127118 RepID=UPI00300FBD35
MRNSSRTKAARAAISRPCSPDSKSASAADADQIGTRAVGVSCCHHFTTGDTDRFAKNVGTTDRTIGGLIGAALILTFFFVHSGTWSWVALIAGIVLLGTAALGICPPYALLGINTCARQ